MPANIVRDLHKKRVMIPEFQIPRVTNAECAHCDKSIMVAADDLEAVPSSIEVSPLCVECIPAYLAGGG